MKTKNSTEDSQIIDQSYSSFSDENAPQVTFDTILTKVGFGRYQIFVFIIVGVIGMCDAGETQAISLVLPILEKEWGISDFQESLMGSLIYSGYLIGSLLSGFIADRFGRKFPIFLASGLMFVCALIGAFMPNYILYTILRVSLVTCVGFIIPISFSMLAENTPLKQRGIVLVFIGVFYTLGELTVCFLAWIFMPTLESGDWRAVLAWASVPAGIVFLISYFFLLESPRFQLTKEKIMEVEFINKFYIYQAKITMVKMMKINQKDPLQIECIPNRVFEQISQDLKEQEKRETQNNEISSFNKIVAGPFCYITPIVWYQWFVNTFVFAGITFILPLTLKKFHPDQSDDDNSNDLKVIAMSCIGEFPTLFIAMVIVNIKYLGRKNSMGLAYLTCSCMNALIFFLKDSGQVTKQGFSFLIAASKLSVNLAFTISYEFTSEIYPTYIRASGIGLASSVGRIGSIIMPWIVVYLNQTGTFTPYLLFGILSIIGSVLTFCLPFDTYNRELDEAIDKRK